MIFGFTIFSIMNIEIFKNIYVGFYRYGVMNKGPCRYGFRIFKIK